MSVSKLKFELDSSNFKELVDRIGELSQISDTIKFKFDRNHLLTYSLVANETAVLCLKSYILETQTYFKNFNDERNFDLVISSASKFVKNIKFFEGFEKIKAEIAFKPSYENPDVMHIRSMTISTPASKGDRLRITIIGAELSRIRDLNKEALEKRMDDKFSKWRFKLIAEDLSLIKKMSTINNDDKTITINIENNIVYFSEDGKWNLQVSETEFRDSKVTFNKKYLSHILSEDNVISFKIFETFILVSTKHSNLLLSFETDFTTDD